MRSSRREFQTLGEVQRQLERLREAEALAERLNDDRHRGRVCAFMTNILALLGELDEARAAGMRALSIARTLGDLQLCTLSTSFLEQACYFRGEYAQVVKLAVDNLAALPPEWTYEHFENSAPASVWDRSYLVVSLAELAALRGAGYGLRERSG